MQTWWVVIVLGQIVATVGPTDLDKCKRATATFAEEVDATYKANLAQDLPPFHGRIIYRNDVYSACFMQPQRPLIGEKVEAN